MRKWIISLGLVMLAVTAFASVATAESAKLNATAEDGILVFESDDSAFKWWVDARVYLDVATYFDDGPLYNVDGPNYEDEGYDELAEMQNTLPGGAILRRARFALKSQLWNDWYGEIDLDFAEEAAAVKDAYISYRGLFGGNGRVRVGNFRQPFGLEEVTTSRNLMFMERSQGTEPFVVGRRMGVEVTRWYPKFRWSASMFGADVEDYFKEANEQINFAARLNWTPIQTDESTLLIGGSGTLQKPTFIGEFEGEKDPSSVKLNSRPESNVSDTKFVYARVRDVESYSVFGGELAYVNKRFMAQAEYMGTSFSRFGELQSLSHSGGYIFASFFLTEDMHHYDHKDAEFARVVPTSQKGAWEVAARFSTVDMNDDTLDDPTDDPMEKNNRGGGSTSITLGVNYYPNPNVKLMLNYGIVDNDEYATGDDEEFTKDYDFSYLSMRFQTAF
jgi:phosphate-selective porin OprO/OprP